MKISNAHEGVVTHPVDRAQLWVVNPDVARGDAGSGIAGLKRRLAVHRRNRAFLGVAGFLLGAAIGAGAAWLASYNALGFAVLALIGGALVAFLAVPRLFPVQAAVTADFGADRMAPLFPLGVYGIGVDDTTSWETLWVLASNFSELFDAESALDTARERSSDQPVSDDELRERDALVSGLRRRALDQASSVWIPVGAPHPFGESLTDRV